jgi:hypothetical protein
VRRCSVQSEGTEMAPGDCHGDRRSCSLYTAVYWITHKDGTTFLSVCFYFSSPIGKDFDEIWF